MRSISQRELRNDITAVVREVENGTSFTVTRRRLRGSPRNRLGGTRAYVDGADVELASSGSSAS